MKESAKTFISMSMWIAIVLFVLRCWVGCDDLCATLSKDDFFECGYSIFGFAGESIGFAALFMAGFNKWWWKWKPLNWLSGGMPVLAKRYKGKIRFSWDDKDQERDTEIRIEQSFLTVKVKLGTDESFSNSVTATIKEENGSKMLVYTYLNMPRAELQNRSVIHYGTAMLNIDNPKHITGNYYTTRLSRGSMDFEAVLGGGVINGKFGC